MASLEEEINNAGGALALLRQGRSGAYPFPIRPEFTNWRDEQEAWRNSAALMDLSHHMTDLVLQGPDTYKLLESIGANSFEGFGPDSAKQLIAVRPDGYMIGDCILFCVGDHDVRIVGRPPALNWVEFHAATGGWDVTVRRDECTVNNPKGRDLFRLQLQGPYAAAVFEKVNGGPMPDIPFFHMGRFKVGPHEVRALNHRMSGFPGYEFTGPYADFEAVRDRILEAGAEYGLRQIGGRAYASVATESGWIANTLPATYTGEDMKAFRDWMPARSFEGNLALAGSHVSERIEDYYTTPWDLGYGHIVNFDHDFIGREGLEQIKDQPHRRKAWVLWNRDDVAGIFASMYEQGNDRFKYLEMPAAFYTACQFDRVEKSGELVGAAMLTVYSSNVRGWISLGTIDPSAAVGDEVEIVWGEPDGGSPNPAVERHTQTRIRGTVMSRPFPNKH
ncbi:aminomethyl transferase family protein [Streptomyces sp. NPDC094038]|uniref:aminomethyl transferase family protein n=1 Tax=Streptomyces sp. NPDC094038 TaxID=3366055 RepID=UPI0038209AC5